MVTLRKIRIFRFKKIFSIILYIIMIIIIIGLLYFIFSNQTFDYLKYLK